MTTAIARLGIRSVFAVTLSMLAVASRSATATATYSVTDSVSVSVKSLDAGVVIRSIELGRTDSDFFGEGRFTFANSADVDTSAADEITVSTSTDGIGVGPQPATTFATLSFATGNIFIDNTNAVNANAVIELRWNWGFDLKAFDDLSSVAGVINWEVHFDVFTVLKAQDEIRGVDFGPGALVESQSGSEVFTLSLAPGIHVIHARVLSIGAVAIPEPAAITSAMIGLLGLGALKRSSRRADRPSD